jgi:hypothetical protein
MNESEKARRLADTVGDIINAKYKRYAWTVAERLEYSPLVLNMAGEPATRWNEFKTHLRQKPHLRDVVDAFVKRCCSELLRELPADERDVLWLSETADKSRRDALALELYYRVQDLAVREAERQAFYAGTPSETKMPVSITSDEIVIPLADYLGTAEILRELWDDLEKSRVRNILPIKRDSKPEEVEDAVRVLLEDNPRLIPPEELQEAMTIPRDERGEYLFGRLKWNL